MERSTWNSLDKGNLCQIQFEKVLGVYPTIIMVWSLPKIMFLGPFLGCRTLFFRP